MVGYSMGALITAKLLESHPKRLITATLGGHSRLVKNEANLKFFDELGTSLEQGKGFGPLIAALTPPGTPPASAEQIQGINARLSSTNDVLALAAVARGFAGLSVNDDKLVKTKVPVQALIGSADPLKMGVDELAAKMPKLKVTVINGATHVTAGARPEFAKAVKEFIAAK